MKIAGGEPAWKEIVCLLHAAGVQLLFGWMLLAPFTGLAAKRQ
jgi:hypothetical protein